MDESDQDPRVAQELYFLIAKFLSGGPLKETAKTLLKELENVEVLPRRLDWQGHEHTQTYKELLTQYSDIKPSRLVEVCKRVLQIAKDAPIVLAKADPSSTACTIGARLSLLGDTLIKPDKLYSPYRENHSFVHRLTHRDLGISRASRPGGAGGSTLLSPRFLSSLQLQRRTLGHLSAVYCLVFDCTGRYVITGADDLLIKVWCAADGRLITTLRGAGAEITDICVSSDGTLVAAGSVDRAVRVWNLQTGAAEAVLHSHQGTITAVHWSPQLTPIRWLASTSTDGSVSFWSATADGFSPRPIQFLERTRPGHCHMICAAWSKGGRFLAAGSADHHVRIYAFNTQYPHRILEAAGHTDAVDSLSWSHCGLRLVSGSKDGTAALWTLLGQWRKHALVPPTPNKVKVTMVCWDISDQYIMTAVSDFTIRVWCAKTCTQVMSLSGHTDETYVLEPHPYIPGVFLSAAHDGKLNVWSVEEGKTLFSFVNEIEGQGSGPIFDAKWGSGVTVAASDSHGHLLLFGIGAGHDLYGLLPLELFFHTDYRPLVRDALGGALDEQSNTPPHLMPPAFLVDVEGAPHPAALQRLVPGRAALPPADLVPAPPPPPPPPPQQLADREGIPGAHAEVGGRGVWRGEGVRRTAGSWQTSDAPPPPPAPMLLPLPPAQLAAQLRRKWRDLNEYEAFCYSREIRRRPLMINTETKRRHKPRPTPRPKPLLLVERLEEDLEPESSSDTSDTSVRLSGSDSDSSRSDVPVKESSSSSSESQYSEWENGPTLAPPTRARRRPQPNRRYSPSASASTSRKPQSERTEKTPPPPVDLPEAYKVGDWLTAVSPRKSPYHPQMGDECLYFRLGHQRYFEAVAEKDVYKVNQRDKPWERTEIQACELVKVVGVKYVIVPPRVACLKLAAASGRRFTARFHDMPDVIDFFIPKTVYDVAVGRNWGQGDRFRCLIDDCWWMGTIIERTSDPEPSTSQLNVNWASAAKHFLSLKVRWDNGEVERLSPWDLEPIDNDRLPSEPGGAVPVLSHEVEAMLYREPSEWIPTACRAIANYLDQVMSLSAAEPFVAPVDLQRYPAYAMCIPYPIDLSTIRARFHNLFYRRQAAAQFDVRYLASNAEMFNEPHSIIVRQARLVTDLLLFIIENWQVVDVMAKYHELAADYKSSDDEMTLAQVSKSRPRARPQVQKRASPKRCNWRGICSRVLDEVTASHDAEPFRRPVPLAHAPDYLTVVSRPMDLGKVRSNLDAGLYNTPDQFAEDVRQVFANSRLYNTNKRSRIYSMTVRLSALFQSLWSKAQIQLAAREKRRIRMPRYRREDLTNGDLALPSTSRNNDDSDSEPLARSTHRDRKGKGVGKKTRVRVEPTEEPPPVSSPDEVLHRTNGIHSPPPSEPPLSRLSNHMDDDEQNDDDDDHNDDDDDHNDDDNENEEQDDHVDVDSDDDEDPPLSTMRKRRRNSPHSDNSEHSVHSWDKQRRSHKRHRTREAVLRSGSSSSSSISSHSESARRYESDRSYHPKYSSDDDAPLTVIRQRQENGEMPSSSVRRRNGVPRVKLRARAAAAGRYNEDSEDDVAAAISKRHRAHSSRHNPAHIDHNYFSDRRRQQNGESSSNSQNEPPVPVSISSRGRLRKLTPKARGLLAD